MSDTGASSARDGEGVDDPARIRALRSERDDLRALTGRLFEEVETLRARERALLDAQVLLRRREADAVADAVAARGRLRDVLESGSWRIGRAVTAAAGRVRLGDAGARVGLRVLRSGGARRAAATLVGGEAWAFPVERAWDGPLAALADDLSRGYVPDRRTLEEQVTELAPDATDALLDGRFDADARDALNALRLALAGRSSAPVRGGTVAIDVRATAGGRGNADAAALAVAVLEAVDGLLAGYDDIVVIGDAVPCPLMPTLDPRRHTTLLGRARFVDERAAQRERVRAATMIVLCGAPVRPLPGCLARRSHAVAFVPDIAAVSFPRHEAGSAADLVRMAAWLVWLRAFDELWCASSALADDLAAAVGIERARTRVYGFPGGGDIVRPGADHRTVVLVGDGGARANLLAPVRALGAVGGRHVVVVGAPGQALLEDLHEVAAAGACTLEVTSATGAELAQLLSVSAVVVAPGHVGGASFAVNAAVAAGLPVLASAVGVHRELLGEGPWLVPAAHVAGWADAFARLDAEGPGWALAQRDANGGAMAGRSSVSASVVAALPQPRAVRRRRPTLAVITPLPPQRSGIADYSAHTLRGLERRFDVSYVCNHLADVGTAVAPRRDRTITAAVGGDVDHVLHVLGNSHFHVPALEHLMTFGGAAIAHDSRMSGVYRHWRGAAETARVMSMHGATVSEDDVDRFVFDIDRSPDSCFGEIAVAASPLFVHSPRLAAMIGAETGTTPVVLPFCPYRVPRPGELPGARAPGERIRVASFGEVNLHFKRTDLLIEMTAWLRQWGVAAELVVVGGGPDGEVARMHQLADECGVGAQVSITGRTDDDEYRWWLANADVAVQVRSSTRPALSGAILDAAAYGLPIVTTRASADEVPDAPMVVPVPDDFTATDLATAVQSACALARDAAAEDARRAFLAARNADAYAQLIADTLLDGVP